MSTKGTLHYVRLGTESAPRVLIAFKHFEYEGEHPPSGDQVNWEDPKYHVYSRYTQPLTSRVEAVLSSITVQCPCVLWTAPEINLCVHPISMVTPLHIDQASLLRMPL